MSTQRERIMSAVVAALDAPDRPAGLTVHRFRARPFGAEALPAMVVFPRSERVETSDFMGNQQRTLSLRVECRVTGDVPDTALDPLYAWAVRAILQDEALAGLTMMVREESVLWDAEAADVVYGAAAIDFEITYQTAGDDPALPGG